MHNRGKVRAKHAPYVDDRQVMNSRVARRGGFSPAGMCMVTQQRDHATQLHAIVNCSGI